MGVLPWPVDGPVFPHTQHSCRLWHLAISFLLWASCSFFPLFLLPTLRKLLLVLEKSIFLHIMPAQSSPLRLSGVKAGFMLESPFTPLPRVWNWTWMGGAGNWWKRGWHRELSRGIIPQSIISMQFWGLVMYIPFVRTIANHCTDGLSFKLQSLQTVRNQQVFIHSLSLIR